MPRYRYEAKKGPGDAQTGVLEAESQRAALARLRDMGYVPTSIADDVESKHHRSLRNTFARIRLKDRNIFFRQLANLYESGMPLTQAFSTIAEQTTNAKLLAVLEKMRDDVQQGNAFGEALERFPKVFTPIQCSLVRAGESGGMLDGVLWRIVTFGEREEEVRGKAVSAMIYPAFLLVVGAAAIFILLSFVFPKFLMVFDDFGATLPWPTLIVLGVVRFMSFWWWAVLLLIAAAVALCLVYVRSEKGRRKWHRLLLDMPVIGSFVQKYQMAQFVRTLGTLMDNGVPILSALRITADTLSNAIIAEEVLQVHGRVAEGESISNGLRHEKHFPPMIISMFAVGEESGRLGPVTQRMADAYDVEVDRAVKALVALVEPVMIVIMGIVVGFLVIAMLLPMLTLSSQIS